MQEPISFCPDPYVRYTKWAARYVLGLRKAMSISDVARFTGLHWETVKNIEKAWLEKRYRKIRLGEVEYLGIDEVHLGRVLGFITVVRDLDSGAVLFVGKGKGGEALEPFGKRPKRRAKTIRKRIKGLLGYWKHGKLTNASQEGFNSKIGWLTRQAYGYRDENSLHLKIYDLPNLSTRRSL